MSGVFVYFPPPSEEVGSSPSSEVSMLNKMATESLREELYRCCGSSRWVGQMTNALPFQSISHLHALANRFWWSSDERDWMEAFSNHPRIGDVNALKEKYKKNPDAWEGGEQSGLDSANESVIMELKAKNDEYDTKFGFLFLVCATGKTATKMLEIIKERLKNTKEAEVLIAVGEQSKITTLRLNKLLNSHRSNL